MSDHDDGIADSVPADVLLEINRLCIKFEQAWRAGQSPRIEDFAARMSGDAQVALLCELIAQEVHLRRAAGQSAQLEEYQQLFPQQARAVNAAFALLQARLCSVDRMSETESLVAGDASETDPNREPAGSKREEFPTPQRLGRFKIERPLGRGAFGDVYLAYDPELDRRVALKVPRRERFTSPEEMDVFVQEARTAAGLMHSGIVTIHDVVRDAELLFIVQEYVEGRDLGNYLRAQNSALPAEQAAGLLAAIAEAVAFAHQKGFVHRDLKPANILLDAQQRPRVADFGLAVHESIQRRHRGDASGTPAYMSPEQVRGETHRLDGRSDIWSLGVVLYELLTGRRPFHGDTLDELFDEIKHRDPKPPRQSQLQVPAELERICLKCLSKRVTERYSSAFDLVDDLRHWPAPAASGIRSSASFKIVPKGLRSFDEKDADFFLELLPGPRDRDGLPESIRFWKTRVEETDSDRSFAVGLVYGPSGCGKSSLVRAGLLPRLASHVLPIYIEATPADTEVRLIKALRKAFPSIPEEASLPEMCASLREGIWLPQGRKVVLVLDQFEQWLHAHRAEQETQLVTALRHCNGGRLQGIVMVRDDFWMAATRFMGNLEIDLLQGQNCAAVDLFDIQHARKVLAAFGCAYGHLPENLSNYTTEHGAFLDQAIAGITEEGKLISVRLALFAEMVKGKPWTPATLHEVGGTEGVGVTFLEETFTASTAAPQHRIHQKAAQAVLKALLPEAVTDIKGHMRSQQELLEASGYTSRAKDFDDLIRILDREIRLITPTDPEGVEGEGWRVEGGRNDERTRYYQLTHDYLVPSLRDWLTRKQRETRKGRAELKLDERAAIWNAKQETKQLPSLWEWLSIRALTVRKKWTVPQRAMMAKATRLHGLRSAFALICLVALISIGAIVRARVVQQQAMTRIEGLVGRLVSAEPNQLPDIVKQLDANSEVAATFLSPLVSASVTTADEKRAQLHARLATVSHDPSLVEPLVEELLAGKVTYVIPIRQLLRPSAIHLTKQFRSLLQDEHADTQRRFRAALALADFVPQSEAASWAEQDLKFVAEQLVSSNAEFQPLLRDALRGIRARLLGDLERIFADAQATDAQRLSAANAFADYAADDVARFSQLLAVATPEQHAVLYPIVAARRARDTIEDLGKIAATLPPEEMGSVERVAYGQRRANAAVTLLRLGEREKVLPVFEMTDDPEALTQFIFRSRPRGVGVDALLDCLRLVSDAPKDRYPKNTRYALLLALGEFAMEEIPASRREALLNELADWYRQDPSSGVHGASGWLLRQWGQDVVVREVDQTPVPYSPDREWFTLAITVTPTAPPLPNEELGEKEPTTESAGSSNSAAADEGEAAKSEEGSKPTLPAKDSKPHLPAEPLPTKTFYYTFIVFPAREYTIGSVNDEPDRQKDEIRHSVKLTRPFALLDREITFAELIAFSPQYAEVMEQYDAQPADAGFGADWYDSVAFCRWLGQQSGLSEGDQAYADPESLDKEQYPREPNPAANWAPRNWPLELGRRGFRLSTESEREAAGRVGVRTAYGYGSDVALLDRFCWFAENSGKHVHPPQEQRPDNRGLFDMHGNLFEWTHDWYGDYGEVALVDPLGAKMGSLRVFRGGSWLYDAANCRSARRVTNDPSIRSFNFGFRLALSPSGVSGVAEPGQGVEPSVGGTEGASAEQRKEMP